MNNNVQPTHKATSTKWNHTVR